MATTKKKPAAKKSAPKKKTAAAKKKPAVAKQSSRGTSYDKLLSQFNTKNSYVKNPAIRRPAQNDVITFEEAQEVADELNNVRIILENFAAHLRALDRARLNGVGAKTRGFINLAYELAMKTPELLPYWIPPAKFNGDIVLFDELDSLSNLCRQIMELVWNMRMEAADMAYTDALEFYSMVSEAAKRRVDAAESVFNEMRKFFKSRKNSLSGRTTEAELIRDAKALSKGRKEGKIVIENMSPKLIGGKKKIIDKTYKNKGSFKEEEDGEIED